MNMHQALLVVFRSAALAGLLVTAGVWGHATARAADGPDIYYCVVGTAQSGGIEMYPTPQAGLQCFTTEEAAEFALMPYFFCVTGGPGTWKITAYTAPKAGQNCFRTVGEAIATLPPDVRGIAPPGGSYNVQSCSLTAPGRITPGSVYFVRCKDGGVGAMVAPPVGGVAATNSIPAPRNLPRLWTVLMGDALTNVRDRACNVRSSHRRRTVRRRPLAFC